MRPAASSVVADMAAAREAGAAAPMTIGEALRIAQNLRLTPEMLIDGPRAKCVIDTLLSAVQSSSAFHKAKLAGEEVFVLRSRDRSAPAAISTWARSAEEHGCPLEKVREAVAVMNRWAAQDQSNTRWPD